MNELLYDPNQLPILDKNEEDISSNEIDFKINQRKTEQVKMPREGKKKRKIKEEKSVLISKITENSKTIVPTPTTKPAESKKNSDNSESELPLLCLFDAAVATQNKMNELIF